MNNDEFPTSDYDSVTLDSENDSDSLIEEELDDLFEDDTLFSKEKTKGYPSEEEARKLVSEYQRIYAKVKSSAKLSYMEEFYYSDIYSQLLNGFRGLINSSARNALKRFKIDDPRFHKDGIEMGITSGLLNAIINFNLEQTSANFSTFLFSCVCNEVSSELKKTFNAKNNNISLEEHVKPKKGKNDTNESDTLSDFVSAKGFDSVAEEAAIVSEFEEKFMPILLGLLTKEERSVYVFRKGIFGTQIVSQEELANFLHMAQPTVSTNQSNAEKKIVKYLATHRDVLELWRSYSSVLNNETERFKDNYNLAPYQAHTLEKRRFAQELFDEGVTLEEIANLTSIKLKELLKLKSRFEKGEFRMHFSVLEG